MRLGDVADQDFVDGSALTASDDQLGLDAALAELERDRERQRIGIDRLRRDGQPRSDGLAVKASSIFPGVIVARWMQDSTAVWAPRRLPTAASSSRSRMRPNLIDRGIDQKIDRHTIAQMGQ
jgi:hypothetical protein